MPQNSIVIGGAGDALRDRASQNAHDVDHHRVYGIRTERATRHFVFHRPLPQGNFPTAVVRYELVAGSEGEHCVGL